MKIEDALTKAVVTDYGIGFPVVKLSEAISICKDYLKKQRESCVKTYELWYEETECGYKSVGEALRNAPEPE